MSSYFASKGPIDNRSAIIHFIAWRPTGGPVVIEFMAWLERNQFIQQLLWFIRQLRYYDLCDNFT